MLVEINVVIVGLAGWYYQDGDLSQLVAVVKSKRIVMAARGC